MSSIEQRVKKIVAEQLGVKEDEVTNDASFVDDLGADSLDTVELVMALEEEFETEIPDEEAEKITTVQQAIDYINERRIRPELRRALVRRAWTAERLRSHPPQLSQEDRACPSARVVVTGLGIVSPVGNTVATRVGRHRQRPQRHRPDHQLRRQRLPGTHRRRSRRTSTSRSTCRRRTSRKYRSVHPLRRSPRRCRRSRTPASRSPRRTRARIGVAIGSGIGGLATIEENTAKWLEAQVAAQDLAVLRPGTIINMIPGQVSIHYGCTGPNLARRHGLHDLDACDRHRRCACIQYGDADVMIAGGAEMASTPLGLGGFSQAQGAVDAQRRARAREPAVGHGPRRLRAGRGAGVIVLEEYEHAKARGARIYAELVGFGMSGDAHHITAPPEDGEGARLAWRTRCATRASIPTRSQYINAHGTSTRSATCAETIAIKRAFGDHAYKLAVSSTKSMTGHLLGAAGGVEAIFSMLAIRDGVAPPTINLDNPDPKAATSTTCRTPRARRRSTSRCRTPSASAAPTARWCSVLRTEPAAPGSSPVEFATSKSAHPRARSCTTMHCSSFMKPARSLPGVAREHRRQQRRSGGRPAARAARRTALA